MLKYVAAAIVVASSLVAGYRAGRWVGWPGIGAAAGLVAGAVSAWHVLT